MDQLVSTCVFRGAPASVYKGGEEGRLAGQRGRRRRVLLPLGVGFLPPILVQLGFLGGEGREGGRPPSPSPNRTRGGGRGAATLGCPFLLSTKAHDGPLRPNTNSRNSPVLRKIPESLGTFPMSEYSRPIYRSLCLDHFETPRHVPDLIRDSELLRYIKTHKLIIKLPS